ncbi:hypothetical protein [Polyangium spumosum]|uniref:Uncharacterized protein n=1 Tax=Polyangium spumosum TaxID=889282 RepID=A0A6N7Q6T8_9BACT|nr:hypothetical protein [Polyangium spumosum]MRG98630.1 hypothetical protein [Polyangium spumosum]
MTPLRVLVLSALGMMSVGASVYTLTPPRREPLTVASLQEPLAFALELSTELPAETDGGLMPPSRTRGRPG